MSPSQALRPFRQGDLDSLCGLYAIVNAVRKCTSTARVTDRDWKLLFNHLVADDRRELDAGDAVTIGIFNKPLWRRAKAACVYCRRFGFDLEATRPFRLKEWRRLDLPNWLAEQAARPTVAVVLGLTVPWDHWTVLNRVGQHYVTLFDSSGCRRVPLARFDLKRDRPPAVTEPGSIVVFETAHHRTLAREKGGNVNTERGR